MTKRKMKRKIKKGLTVFLILLVLGIGGYFGLTKTGIGKKVLSKANNITNTISEKIEKPKEVWPKIYKASLVATGDGLLHNAVYIDAYDRTTEKFDFRPQLSMVKDIISSYDIAYYNQETLFGGKQTTQFPQNGAYNIAGYFSYPYFNSPSEFGDAMVDAGFNLVSLASNHSTDCTTINDTCVKNSYDYWLSKDIVFAGFKPTVETDSTTNYIIKETNGITYTLLNYTTSLNGLDGYNSGLINMYDEESVKKDIEAVRDKVDVLIVAMHWHTGAEYTFTPTEENKQIATFLADNGVDIVLGTYSHCLQPFDIINDTIVFYSLGNFISNQGDIIDSIGYKGIVGILASMDITKTLNEDGTSDLVIDNLEADLTYTHNNNHKDYRVIPFSKMTEEYNSNYLNIYEEYSKVLTSLNENITIKEAGSNLKEA